MMMRSLAVPLAFVFFVQGQPISKQSGVGVRVPQRFIPQHRFASSPFQPAVPLTGQIPLDYRSSQNAIRTQVHAEAEGASEPEYVNIYEEPLVKCIEDDYCSYRSAAMLSHDICATIRLKMSVEAHGMSWGADGATNDPECENILAYGASTAKRRQDNRGYVMIPQCSALPAGVLDSKFSVDMMVGTTLKETVQKLNYDLDKNSVLTTETRVKKGTILGGSKTQYTRGTNNFRAAINSICELCAAEAPNEKAKENLATACAKIKALDTSVTAAEQETGAINAFATGLVGAFIAGSATFALLRFRSGARVAAEEPFLMA